MLRLEPMSEEDCHESLRRSIPRIASDYVRRGIWTQEASLEASERAFAQLFPDGRGTPGKHFAHVMDAESGRRVGETWYSVQEQGGRIRFWIDWIWIDPEQRRKGYATETLHRLEEEAHRRGADRVGLTVWTDNPGAVALYAKLGFTPANLTMMKLLDRRP